MEDYLKYFPIGWNTATIIEELKKPGPNKYVINESWIF